MHDAYMKSFFQGFQKILETLCFEAGFQIHAYALRLWSIGQYALDNSIVETLGWGCGTHP